MDVKGKIDKAKSLGVCRTLKMPAVKWKKREKGCGMVTSPARKKLLDRIFDREYSRIIFFENHFGYYNIMMQRPQHLLKNMADRDTLVLYNSYYDIDYKDRNRITKVAPSVYVLDLYYFRRCLLELAEQIPHRYVCVYSTDTVPYSRVGGYLQRGFRVIYEYVDDISGDLINPAKIAGIRKRHERLIRGKDVLTVATADRLYRDVLDLCEDARVIRLSNGAECSRFRPETKTDDREYLDWIKEDRIKAGYYGALASWVDYGLLKRLAEDERFQIILIGVEHDDSLEKSGILDYENVRYFGKKPYEQLAGYVHYFDVCMIPFVINGITAATSPVKLFEYMSMEKPVVSTALPECLKYDAVSIAHSPDEFVRLVTEAWDERDNDDVKEKLRQCARGNDWSAKAQELKKCLSQWESDER